MQVRDTSPCTTLPGGRMGVLQGSKNLFIINLPFTDSLTAILHLSSQ